MAAFHGTSEGDCKPQGRSWAANQATSGDGGLVPVNKLRLSISQESRNFAGTAVFETVEAPRSFYSRAPQSSDDFSALPPKPVPLFRKDGGIFLFFPGFGLEEM